MESYLLAQERSWYDFMLDCMTAGGVMKRLDLAINDRVGLGAERASASAGSSVFRQVDLSRMCIKI